LNKYETIIIISPNAETETVDKIIADAQNFITGDESGGIITKLENWGKKRLAYEIKRNKEGIYILIDYDLDPKFIQRFERYCILNEQILKFMTVRAEDIPEPRKKEISKAKFDDDEDFIQPRFTDYDDDDDDFSYDDDDE
jgi:small subunit ribosomal protein S6